MAQTYKRTMEEIRSILAANGNLESHETIWWLRKPLISYLKTAKHVSAAV